VKENENINEMIIDNNISNDNVLIMKMCENENDNNNISQ